MPFARDKAYSDAPVAVVTDMTTATSAANEAWSSMFARSCSEDIHLQRQALALKDMAAEFGQFIQEEYAIVG
jgi:hypothetical protein